MIVSEKNIKFELNDTGGIADFSVNGDLYGMNIPIYPVAFRSHAFRKPVNDHLDDSQKIQINTTNPIQFAKTFDDIEAIYEISVSDNEIKIDIQSNKVNLGLNLGLVVPVQSDTLLSGNDPIFRNMCLYKPSYKYPDQQEITAPCIRFKWGTKDVAIKAESNSGVSFFIHKQNEQNCIRISSESNRISIVLSFNYVHVDVIETQEIEKIFTKIESRLFDLDKEKHVDVTHIFDLCRTLRHAGFCWEVDYIKPNKMMQKSIDLIQRVETAVYASHNSVLLRNKFNAEINQTAAFQTIRAHIRAESGKTPDAITILSQFFKNCYDMLDTRRKGALIYTLAVAYLCDAQFAMSYKLFEELWNLLRYTENTKRYSDGTADAWITLNIIYSFFMYHVIDFRNYFSAQVKAPSSEVYRHKQKYFMQAMEHQLTPIISQIGIGFYNHATLKMADLPKYKI